MEMEIVGRRDIYYIYVGDINTSRKICRVLETRRGTSLRRVCTHRDILLSVVLKKNTP